MKDKEKELTQIIEQALDFIRYEDYLTNEQINKLAELLDKYREVIK